VLVGRNGAGKTNVLEAIAMLSFTKSFLSTEDQDLMQWNTAHYRVRARAQEDTGVDRTFEVVSQIAPRKQKACFVNDIRTPIASMVGQLPSVLFLPQDLQLFTGSPAARRTFLDQLLCQVSPEYLVAITQYQKILKQRNTLLRRIADGSAKAGDLSVWNLGLAEKGAFITRSRLELIEMLQCTLPEEIASLGETWGAVELAYDRKTTERDIDALTRELMDLMVHYEQRDLILQSTTVGPHRDDWHIAVDGRNLTTFASRGQQRTAVLALLFLQVSYVELRRGEKPVILLDDVFSELDDAHQGALLKSLQGHQVIITTTHIPKELHGANISLVENGVVERIASSDARFHSAAVPLS